MSPTAGPPQGSIFERCGHSGTQGIACRECAEARCRGLQAEVERLRAELTKLANPMRWFNDEADKAGAVLDVLMARRLESDAGWYRSQARAALAQPSVRSPEIPEH